MRVHREHGITFIELLVTISIAAILLAVAVPSFRDFLARNRVDSAASDFMVNLNYARSEAIRRGARVTMHNPTGARNWSNGWTMCVDTDSDGDCADEAAASVLRVGQALNAPLTLYGNNNYTNFLSYLPTGRINNFGSFAICYDAALVGAKSITISVTGRPRSGNDTGNDGIPEKDVNGVSTNITSCTNP
ncbi:MAG: GspH/FimT family pseudopilin [Thiobacillaceae bacterium]|jgi:type IV fimbrial biogenesis protein FimT|nr:GspH/FimT family pseudopilin [Thiobacillaceae bacterium]